MVGEIPKIRRAEREGGGRRPLSLSRVARADAWDDGGRCLPGLPEKKSGEPPAAGQRLRQKGRSRLETYLSGFELRVHFKTRDFLLSRAPSGRPPACRCSEHQRERARGL